jgi:hypothetical protein
VQLVGAWTRSVRENKSQGASWDRADDPPTMDRGCRQDERSARGKMIAELWGIHGLFASDDVKNLRAGVNMDRCGATRH